MNRIVIFASGSGSNAENIIRFFDTSKKTKISSVFCNNKNATVFNRCKILKINSLLFNRDAFYQSEKILKLLKEQADFIILAGFLWKIPENIIRAFPNKIINIHPALLPKYGGKGMYGMNVHKAVKENNEVKTGITIHFVNENYDEGAIIFQAETQLEKMDTLEDIAQKIHVLEQTHFPKVIENVLLNFKNA